MRLATVLAAVATVSNVVVVAVLMVVVGAAWVGVQSSWMMAAHDALPTWIRARVIALMLLAFQGCQAAGSLVWGALADAFSLEIAFCCGVHGDGERGHRRGCPWDRAGGDDYPHSRRCGYADRDSAGTGGGGVCTGPCDRGL